MRADAIDIFHDDPHVILRVSAVYAIEAGNRRLQRLQDPSIDRSLIAKATAMSGITLIPAGCELTEQPQFPASVKTAGNDLAGKSAGIRVGFGLQIEALTRELRFPKD
jgi:hypothetical protein